MFDIAVVEIWKRQIKFAVGPVYTTVGVVPQIKLYSSYHLLSIL